MRSKSTLLFAVGIVVLMLAATYLFVDDHHTMPPEPATSLVALVATAPDGTKLWAVATRDGTIYFPSARDNNRGNALPMPPVQ